MPTQHFEKLKTDRKNAIIKAATREFATREYNEVSVRDIADRADISRGSFYIYFEDKEDCYMTVINTYKDHIEQDIMNIYKKADDIKGVMVDIFDYFTHLSSFEKALFEKISNNLSLSCEIQDVILSAFDKFGDNLNQHLEERLIERGTEITPEIKEQLNLRREILFSLLLVAIIEMSLRSTPLTKARNALIKKVDLVMNGIMQELPKSYK